MIERVLFSPVLDLPAEPPAALFDEMDALAVELRGAPDWGTDLVIIFRQLQKARMPELPSSEFAPLFAAWRDRFASKMQRELDQLRSDLDAYLRERAAAHPGPPLFRCPCGEEIDPADPLAFEAHRPARQGSAFAGRFTRQPFGLNPPPAVSAPPAAGERGDPSEPIRSA